MPVLLLKKIFSASVDQAIISADINFYDKFLILIRNGRGELEVLMEEEKISIPNTLNPDFIRWYDKDHFLLAEARQLKGENGFLLDFKGNIVKKLNLGDGIQNIDIDVNGNIWIGYFDEGIFGSIFPSPEGLVCISKEDKVLFKFHSDLPHLKTISDCYMLNVDDNNKCIWISYYTDFPLIKLDYFGNFLEIFELPPDIHGGKIFCQSKEANIFYFFDTFKYKNALLKYNFLNKEYSVFKLSSEEGFGQMGSFARSNKLIFFNSQKVWTQEV